MKHLKICILTFVILFCASVNLSAQKIHAIAFCNTLDSKIGESCANDHDRFKDEIELIAPILGYELVFTSKIAENCSKDNLMSVLQNLNTTDKDIIFFYYSGHGSHAPGDNDLLPQMCLKYNAYEESKWVPVKKVDEILSTKSGALKIIMTDCCNKVQDFVSQKFALMECKGNTTYNDIRPENYRKLFLEAKGKIIVTSSKKGQVSYGPKEGGVFSISFWNELWNAGTTNQKPDWNSLLAKVKSSTLKVTQNKQEPYYTINVHGDHPVGPTPVVVPVVVNPEPNQSSLTNALTRLINNEIDLNIRVSSIPNVISTYFTANASVAVIGRDMITVVDYTSIDKFLRNITLAGNIQQISVVSQSMDGGKVNFLKVHEIIKK